MICEICKAEINIDEYDLISYPMPSVFCPKCGVRYENWDQYDIMRLGKVLDLDIENNKVTFRLRD